MNHDHAAALLADAAVASVDVWSRQQRRAARRVAAVLASAWDVGLIRDDIRETLLFKGDAARRLASARWIVSAFEPHQLEDIFEEFGSRPRS